jgi:uncharacterized membrane protein YgcG
MKHLLLLLLLPCVCIAQIPDPKPGTYVNDFTRLLDKAEIDRINIAINEVEKKYSVQIAVVLLNDLPANYNIEDYAREVGRKWHVGNARNGLVYVAAIKQRKQRLEVSANLEGSIPDITAKRLTDNVKPFFRNQAYGSGIMNLIKEINTVLDPVKEEQQQLGAQELSKKQESNILIVAGLVLCVLGVIAGVAFFMERRRRRQEKQLEEIRNKHRAEEREIAKAYREKLYAERLKDEKLSKLRQAYSAPSKINENKKEQKNKEEDNYTPPIIPIPDVTPTYKSPKSDDNSSDYGNWGGGSSDTTSSSDSGFSGGGSSNDW